MQISSKNSSFNENPYLRESHNCYSYFLNLKDPSAIELCKKTYGKRNICRRSQPGYASHYPALKTADFNCPTILKRTLADNPYIFKTDKKSVCGPAHYKGAVVVAPGRDYHYYRHNDENIWTHKPGYKPSTYLDAKNKIITDPETADRDYGGTLHYKDFCGFVCVPKDPTKKQMKMYNDTNNSKPLKRIKKSLNTTIRKIIKNRNRTINKNKMNVNLNNN